MKYKSLFLSDIHQGSAHSRVDKVLNFLHDNYFDNIFLVGDIIDCWELKRKWRWTKDDNLFIQKILRESRKGTNIVFCRGNHDYVIGEIMLNHNLGDIQILDEYIYESFGKKYLIIHGDKFDGLVRFCPWLQKIGSIIYELSIGANYIIRKFGIHWSLSSFLKQKAKGAVNFIAAHRKTLIDYAKTLECQGVITGHTHSPEIIIEDNILFANVGDMVENFSIVVQKNDGDFELIYL
jgi:UDP-2,3-diacylglucosamine pyrophosphatase LpxH